jgi:hypothetical protein
VAAIGACAGAESDSGIRVIPVRIAPVITRDVAVAVISPQAGEVVQNPVRIELVLGGFELGVPTPGAEERGIMLAEGGQHLHVIVDDEPYISVYDASEPVTLPELSPGPHTVRVFPALQWHESLKGPGTFEALQFYVGQASGDLPIRPGAPLLTYGRPLGTYAEADADSVLLDFLVRNARFAAGGYKVRLSVDGQHVEDLTELVPYYLVGLTPGEHTVELQLREAGGRIVPGAYNTTSRTITIER